MQGLEVSYAKALYSLSEDMNIEDELLSEMGEVSAALAENADFIKLLNSPALPLEERHSVVDDVFGGAREILVNFIKLLTEGRMMHLFERCARLFAEEYNDAHNIEKVIVESASELDDAQTEALKQKLEKMTGKKIVLNIETCPELIGGMVVKMRDRRFDGSVAKKLSDIHEDIYKVIV